MSDAYKRGIENLRAGRFFEAHEELELVWRAAAPEERDFYQGLIQIAAGLLHLQRRNSRGAQNKLREGLARLRPYQPVHHGILVTELVAKARSLLNDLEQGYMPYLIPPVIRYAELDMADLDR